MSVPGWYPDPAGAPGRYRYWDGQTWSAEVTADPQQAHRASTPRAASRSVWLVVAVVLVAALVGASVLATRSVRAAGVVDLDPRSTASNGWDDSFPTPTPSTTPSPPTLSTTPPPAARPTPRATPTRGTSLADCPTGAPQEVLHHRHDGRVHGGNLSFAEVATFDPAVVESRLSFAHDVAQQTLAVNADPRWIAQLAVGRLLGREGFTGGPEKTARSVAECSLNGNMYQPYTPHRSDVRSESLTVDGRAGWLIEADVTVQTPGLSFPGDHVIFVVVPDGEDWGMFFGAVPIGDAALDGVLRSTLADLRVG